MDDLSLAIEAARVGGSVVTRWFGEGIGSDLKRRNDPVTIADRESEAAILALLGRERPDDTIVAEEGGVAADHGAGRRWLIDPLDGTVNFVHGIPQVAVSIALYDGPEPLVGVVLDVMRDELFAAATGRGTTLNGNSIEVSPTRELDRAVVGTGFPYDHHEHPDDYAATVGAMLAHVNGIRRAGAAAIDLAWVAAGRFDAHWEYLLEPWDIAAGTVLVREAGGTVTNEAGDDLVPEDGVVLASNGLLHEPLLDILRSAMPPHIPVSTPRS
jgi:myo-inositol-1(or 4)-monophosphatase